MSLPAGLPSPWTLVLLVLLGSGATLAVGLVARATVLDDCWFLQVEPDPQDDAGADATGSAEVVRAASSWWSLARVLLRGRGGLVGVAWLLTLGATVLDLAAPWPVQVVVDTVLGGRPTTGLGAVLAGWDPLAATAVVGAGGVVLVVTASLTSSLAVVVMGAVEQQVTLRLRRLTLSHVLRGPVTPGAGPTAGEVQTRVVTDSARTARAVVALGDVLLPDVLVLVGMVAVTSLVDWRLSLVAVAFVPVLVAAARRRNTRLEAAQRGARQAGGEVAAQLTDLLSRRVTVRLCGTGSSELRHALGLARTEASAVSRTVDVAARFLPVTELLPAVTFAGVLVVGVWEVRGGRLSTGELLVFLAYLSSLHGPIRRLTRLSADLSRGAASRDRLVELLWPHHDGSDAVRPSSSGRPAARPAARATAREDVARKVQADAVRLDALSVRHRRDLPVLDGLDVVVRRGDTVAVTGPSGSGKTTLLWAVAGLLPVDAGTVRLFGRRLPELGEPTVRSWVAMAPQDPELHPGTLAENIAYGVPGATAADIRWASYVAGVDLFADSLPEGLDTPAGPGGRRLSGGQQRRVALARAVIRQAPLVLLDEPTAGLDRSTSTTVVARLRHELPGTTVLVATHDLGLVDVCDHTLVLSAPPGPRGPQGLTSSSTPLSSDAGPRLTLTAERR